MDRVFMQAVLSPAPVIMGIQLRPMSVGHSYLLAAVQSPFAVGGKVDRADLATAVIICAHDWDAGRALLFGEDGRLAEESSDLGEIVHEITADMTDAERDEWFTSELDAFDRYMEIARDIPDHFSNGQERSYRAPWEWHAVRLMCQNGLAADRSAAWNTPLNEAMCWRSVVVEHMGDDSIEKQEDREHRARDAKRLLDEFGGDAERVAEVMSNPMYKLTAADVRRFLMDLPKGAG